MSSTLSLEASKKVFEIVGEYETEKCWLTHDGVTRLELTSCIINYLGDLGGVAWFPAPTFSELIRVLPKLIRAKRPEWRVNDSIGMYAEKYALAPTEPEGMAAVETYLMKLL